MLTDLAAGWTELDTPKRPTAAALAKPPTEEAKAKAAEAIVKAEAERQRQRAATRAGIAAAELAEQQHEVALRGIDAINERKESLASAHVAECAPLQRRLVEIENLQIANIKARADSDPAIEQERREVLASLREKNASLEAAIEHQDKLLAQIEAERLDAAKRCGTSSLQFELIQTGRPDLLAKMRVTSAAKDWANSLLEQLQARATKNPSVYTRAEVAAAHEAVTQATQQAAAALQAVLAE